MTLDRYIGSLLGLATGDALGTTLEFTTPGQFEPVTTLTGGGPFALKPGQWTDDTSMALCLAESLVEKGFDPQDQMERYVRWFREGYLSSTDTTGAVFGQIAGALYGAQAIPTHWRRQIAMRDRIEELASQLHARAIT